jgi:hypothetical protein
MPLVAAIACVDKPTGQKDAAAGSAAADRLVDWQRQVARQAGSTQQGQYFSLKKRRNTYRKKSLKLQCAQQPVTWRLSQRCGFAAGSILTLRSRWSRQTANAASPAVNPLNAWERTTLHLLTCPPVRSSR